MKNVTVLGNIYITNLNAAVTTDIRLSTFFGNVLPTESDLLTQRNGNFNNISSGLVYHVNGVVVTGPTQTVTNNATTSTINLVSSLDYLLTGGYLPTGVTAV